VKRLQGGRLSKPLFLDNRLDNRQQITRLDSLLIVCFQAVTEIVDGGHFKPLKPDSGSPSKVPTGEYELRFVDVNGVEQVEHFTKAADLAKRQQALQDTLVAQGMGALGPLGRVVKAT
jgi:hypothetical protein